MSIHKFRSKPNRYGKPPCENRTQNLLVSKFYLTLKMAVDYKTVGTRKHNLSVNKLQNFG
ncbi:hypothetical protein Hanom_Chr07g00627071 [Helianthus anomalus]